MKIRALANGNVIEAHEDAAKVLIENGIYEVYDEKAEKKSTAVKPLTTADMPKQPKKGKPIK